MAKASYTFRAPPSARRQARARARKRRARVRLSVFRSGKHIYAQLIDDSKGVTLAAASTLDKDLKGKRSTVEAAKAVGADRRSARRKPKVKKWCSTAAAICSTDASKHWRMRRARAGWQF